jgi:hypothetical protein
VKLLFYPNLSKCLQFCSTMQIIWLTSNLNLPLSNLYGRYLPLAFWSLNYKIWVQRTNFLKPNHWTTVPSDLFYDEILTFLCQKLLGGTLRISAFKLLWFSKKIKSELCSKEEERHGNKSQKSSERKHFSIFLWILFNTSIY